MEQSISVEETSFTEGRSSRQRTWTMRNTAARQKAVNLMPSRQQMQNTVRLRRVHSDDTALLDELTAASEDEPTSESDVVEQHASVIVKEMEMDCKLMEDNPEAEEKRREALRELPQGITTKKSVRAKLSASVSLRSKRKPISAMKRLKYRISFAMKRFRERIRNVVFSIELWYEHIRRIEGHFGSAVGSYFYLLRWLFVTNLLASLVVVGFVVVPQVLIDQKTNSTYLERQSHPVLEFLSGKGFVEESVMFYKHYDSGVAGAGGASNIGYSMPFAYFFTMLLLYMTLFLVLALKTAWSYRRNFIETQGGLSNMYSNKIFCSWDFGIATEEAARLNARSIYNEFKELLSEQMKNNETIPFWTRVGRILTNILMNTLSLVLIAGVEAAFWTILSNLAMRSIPWSIGVSLLITAVQTLCPLLFNQLVRLEYYRPRTALYITLARTFILDVSTIYMVFHFWFQRVECWETEVGQETYRLILLDSLFSLILLPIVQFARKLVYSRFPKGSPQEFNIASNSLTLIYNQALLCLGLLFAPLLVVMATVKMAATFYVQSACAMCSCQPARKIWRAAQTQTLLYMLVTLSLFGAMVLFGYQFLRSSSQVCGPFQNYEHVYQVLTEGVLNLSHHQTLYSILKLITRPGVIAFVLLFLSVAVYYVRAKSLAHRSMVKILREMLVLEAKDKEFLLSAISKVSDGEWMYSPRLEDLPSNDSHTWKYLNDDKIRKPSNSGFQFERVDKNSSNLSSAFKSPRPHSYINQSNYKATNEVRPKSLFGECKDDGDTDSSFSWQGSTTNLNKSSGDKNLL